MIEATKAGYLTYKIICKDCNTPWYCLSCAGCKDGKYYQLLHKLEDSGIDNKESRHWEN